MKSENADIQPLRVAPRVVAGRAGRIAAISLALALFAGSVAWLRLTTLKQSPAETPVSDVRWEGAPGPGEWRVIWTARNDGPGTRRLTVTCSLHDPAGRSSPGADPAVIELAPGEREIVVVTVHGFHATPDRGSCRETTSPTSGPVVLEAPLQLITGPQRPPPPPVFQPAALAFWDATHGWLIGAERGTICPQRNEALPGYPISGSCVGIVEATSDGGRNWTVVDRDTQATGGGGLLDVAILGPGQAWVIAVDCPTPSPPELDCAQRVLRSTDGGDQWEAISAESLTTMSFATEDNGWAIGPRLSSLLGSTDGGRHWKAVRDPCPRATPLPTSVVFTGPVQGWLMCAAEGHTGWVRAKTLMTTVDGARTWNTVSQASAQEPATGRSGQQDGLPETSSYRGIKFLADGHGWLWDDGGWLFGTEDGGLTWRLLWAEPNDWINSVSFVSDLRGYALRTKRTAAGDAMELVTSGDGGRTWMVLSRWDENGY